MGDRGSENTQEKTEIIDQFLDIINEDLLYWDFKNEQVDTNGIQRVYSKTVVNDKPIAASEVYYRARCLIKNAEPKQIYNMFVDTKTRLAWDNRMEHMEDVPQEGMASNEFAQYFVVAKTNLPLVTQRDCLVKVQKRINYPKQGEYTYAFIHHKDDKFPENNNDLLRTSATMTGYHFKPAPDGRGTIVEWFQNIDVHGSIPTWLFRMATTRMHMNMYRLVVQNLDNHK